MRLPQKHSWKWILMFFLTILLCLLTIGLTIVILGYDQVTSTFTVDLAMLGIMLIFFAFIITFMGFFGWFFMWSFTAIALFVSTIVSASAIHDNSSGWALFVAAYLTVILEGISLLLGVLLQIASFIIVRKKSEEEVEAMSTIAKRIVGAYAIFLIGGLVVVFTIGT